MIRRRLLSLEKRLIPRAEAVIKRPSIYSTRQYFIAHVNRYRWTVESSLLRKYINNYDQV